jgi:hypothetical protein
MKATATPARGRTTRAHHSASSSESDQDPAPERQSSRMEQIRAEIQTAIQAAIQALREEVLTAARSPGRRPRSASPGPSRCKSAEQTAEALVWAELLEPVPAGPELTPVSKVKLYKIAHELQRLASLMTADRDRHDIHTVSCWHPIGSISPYWPPDTPLVA